MKPPATLKMWAAVVRSKRSQWIHSGTLHGTREGAKDKYLSNWLAGDQKEELGSVTFLKVEIRVLP